MMNGVIIINKPEGKTSHDIVNILRRKFGTRRVGHTGTLDPMATGVLPVCIGNATRASDMLTDSDKKYRAELLLGKRTDTLDIEGEILEEKPVSVTETEIRDAIIGFVGEIDQIPPMYSAIKKDGKKLYDLARQGIEIEREPRRISIYSIDIIDINIPYITIDVHCSKGTYIRSLCDDIGTRLGTGAVMTKLCRTYTAGFSIDEAYTLDELDAVADMEQTLKATDTLFEYLPEIRLNEKQEKSIVNGVRMSWRQGTDGETYRLYGADGRFLCISRLVEGRLVLIKSFWS